MADGGAPFGERAARLAGLAGLLLGWRADEFWRATPAELACVLGAMAPDADSGATGADLQRLMGMFPDG